MSRRNWGLYILFGQQILHEIEAIRRGRGVEVGRKLGRDGTYELAQRPLKASRMILEGATIAPFSILGPVGLGIL